MRRRRFTQYDVAARAGLNQGSVSLVILRNPRIRAETAERVWVALEELFAEFPVIAVGGRRKDGTAA